RRGEIQVVDGCVFHQNRVAYRVHARGHGPYHFLPLPDVHVVVDHDDELRVHELAQHAPDAEHHSLGMAGILLADRNDGQAITAALGRQVEVDDLGQLSAQQGHEDLVERNAEHSGLV